MNAQEKKVIRWKRDLIASNLVFDDSTIQRLKSHDLIWDSAVAEINGSEIKNCEKVWKYLEHLMRAKLDRNVFQAFCEFLDEENPWISSELRVELSLERGQLKIDEYIKSEVSTLVHRYFGTSKRIGENEKKQFEELLAMRIQCTKNIWIKNVEQTKQALIAQTSFEKQRSSIQKEMLSRIMSHLQQGKDASAFKKNSFCEEPLTEKEAHLWMSSKNTLLLVKTLEDWVDKLLDFSTTLQGKNERLMEEKERSEDAIRETMKAIGFEALARPRAGIRTDKEIKTLVKSFNEKLDGLKVQLGEKVDSCQELQKTLRSKELEYEEELKERDRHIRFLTDNLEKWQGDLSQKARHLDVMDENLGEANEKITTLEEKLKYWERYRHFGYWYARNQGDLAYSIDEVNPRKKVSGIKPKVASSRKSTTTGSK